MTYQQFYESVLLPVWAPPPWAFGLAWGIIYPLFLAATAYLAYLTIKRRVPRTLILVLAANWALNLAFTPVQLGTDRLWPASFVILGVLGTLAYFQWHIRRHSMLIFWLLVPYLAWGIFATALQLTITVTNGGTVGGAISTFEECAAAGYPIAESYPRQCRTPDGRRFLEDVEEPVFCTADAKRCPDGSYVGRMPPACEFAPCPGN